MSELEELGRELKKLQKRYDRLLAKETEQEIDWSKYIGCPVEFRDSDEPWHVGILINYSPESAYQFATNEDAWEQCRLPEKTKLPMKIWGRDLGGPHHGPALVIWEEGEPTFIPEGELLFSDGQDPRKTIKAFCNIEFGGL